METLPFEIAETAHALRKSFDRRAVGMGVTRAQWKVLFRLSRRPGLRQIELADMLDIEPITLSRIIDRLEEAAREQRAEWRRDHHAERRKQHQAKAEKANEPRVRPNYWPFSEQPETGKLKNEYRGCNEPPPGGRSE